MTCANETTRLFPSELPANLPGPGWEYRGIGWDPGRVVKQYAITSDQGEGWIITCDRVPDGLKALHYAEKVSQ